MNFALTQLVSKDILPNTPFEDGVEILDSLISNETEWSKEKVRLLLYKSNWYNRHYDQTIASQILSEIPIDITKEQGYEGDYYLQKAIIADMQNEPSEASKYYRKARDYFINIENHSAELYVTGSLLEFFRKNQQFEIGLDEAKTAFEKIENEDFLIEAPSKIVIYSRYAALLNETGDNRSSVKMSKKALQLAKSINDRHSQAIAHNELAFSYKNLIHEDKAYFKKSANNYEKAEKLYRELDASFTALIVKENKTTLYAHNDNISDKQYAIHLYKEIIKEVEEKQLDNYNLLWVYRNLYGIYRSLGDYKQAMTYQELEFKESVKYNNKKKDIEIAKIADEFQSLKLQTENDRIKEDNRRKEEALNLKRRTVQLFWISTVFLVVILLFVLYLFHQKRKVAAILEEENRQKDLLIQEVHHRVKNNLQFIISLLEMQKNAYTNMEEAIAMQETMSRISSMSLVHQMLYNNSFQEEIDLKIYCEELISLLKDSFNLNERDIKTELHFDSILVSSPNAISIGLIINEFFINSVKYAFFDKDNPVFEMRIRKNDEARNFKLEMWDNGPGLEEEEIEIDKSFGIKLINILSKLLKSEPGWAIKDNVYFSITVPYEIK